MVPHEQGGGGGGGGWADIKCNSPIPEFPYKSLLLAILYIHSHFEDHVSSGRQYIQNILSLNLLPKYSLTYLRPCRS